MTKTTRFSTTSSKYIVVLMLLIFVLVIKTTTATYLRTQLKEEPVAEEEDPCKESKDPNCIHFHRSWTGKVLKAPHAAVHSHEWLADLSGRTKPEREASGEFLNASPKGTVGSNWVKACPNFPYCTNTPAPPPVVPAPWRMLAPAPGHVYPSLAEPKYPLPWRMNQKMRWLATQSDAVKKKVMEQKKKMEETKKKELQKAYKEGRFPPRNPERLDLRQYPLAPKDMKIWMRDFAREESYTGKVSYAT